MVNISLNVDAVTNYSSSVYNVQLVCGRRFPLQLGVMLVDVISLAQSYSSRARKYTPNISLQSVSIHFPFQVIKSARQSIKAFVPFFIFKYYRYIYPFPIDLSHRMSLIHSTECAEVFIYCFP